MQPFTSGEGSYSAGILDRDSISWCAPERVGAALYKSGGSFGSLSVIARLTQAATAAKLRPRTDAAQHFVRDDRTVTGTERLW